MSYSEQAKKDKSFDAHVLSELKTLVSDLENDCSPSNIVLYEMIRERLWNPWLKETYP
jgi:hypothetical protein